jgi:hypothetical protein
VESFADQFLSESELTPILLEAIRVYCDRVHLSRHLVEPLFYTSWIYSGLREATRLDESELDMGISPRLLKLAIDHRDAPALKRLFAL